MVKVYLSRKGIVFVEKNISEDAAARQELLSMGYRSTPITVIGKSIIIGYKPQDMEKALTGER